MRLASTRLRAPATAGLAIAAALTQPACFETSCTDIGWREGLTVDLVTAGGYADGGYDVVAVADGITLRGRFTVFGPEAICDVTCMLVADGDAGELVGSLELSGDAGEPGIDRLRVNVHRIRDDGFAGGPARLDLSILVEDVELVRSSIEPAYRSEEINGDGCGVATTAEVTVELADPGDCPAAPPSDGERCFAPESADCVGAEDLTTCGGIYGGQRHCACIDGIWSCPNLFCAAWCPDTFAEAEAGPACDERGEPGACYYGDGKLCGCSLGVIDC